MRVVIDTHVFMSSFFGGNPRRVLDLWRKGKLSLCLSNAILDEYVAVLERMGLAGEKELAELLYIFRNGWNCLFTLKTPTLKICAGPDDDKFIEAAVALKAKFIVSGDGDLLDVEKYLGIGILKPKAFLAVFEKASR